MKNLVKWLPICLSILVFNSCTEQEAPITYGRIQFEFNSTNGKLTSETAAVLLTITKPDGTIVEDMLKLTLYSFGNSYVSESVELPVGQYYLTQFFILDSENNIKYACPVEGSEQSQYVKDPLPIHFEITEDITTSVVPQVLEVTPDADPESFGYVKFGFEIVYPIPVNSLQLTVDDKLWVPSYIEQVIFNHENNFFVITARKQVADKYESLWVIIPDFELKPGDLLPEEVEIQMGFNESETTGTYYDSDWVSGQVTEIVKFTVTDYDSENKLISGKFSGHLVNSSGVKIVKNGVFNKLKVSFQ